MSTKQKRGELPASEPDQAAPFAPDYDPPEADEDVALLKPEPSNPRTIEPERLRKLGYSLEVFGDLGGIVWNEQLGTLAAGHKRMEELRAAGARTWRRTRDGDGVIQHPKTGERFKIRIVRWELPKHQAAMLVANNPHLQGEFTEGAVDIIKGLTDAQEKAELELDTLLADLEPDEKDDKDHPGLEDFDIRPRPRPAWILIGAPAEVVAEIESDLRGRYEGDEAIRIEVATDVHK